MMNEELKNAVSAAAVNGDAARAIRSIYAELQAEIDRRKPICVASGKCCNFETYGHRLYVTTLELAVFVSDLARLRSASPVANGAKLRSPLPVLRERNRVRAETSTIDEPSPPPSLGVPGEGKRSQDSVALNLVAVSQHPLPTNPGGCPLQSGRLCGVHAIRPFGCRIFFCDPTASQWQQDQYEAFHARIKSLHQQFEIPYFYVEWREALRVLNIAE